MSLLYSRDFIILKKSLFTLIILLISSATFAQNLIHPENNWQLKSQGNQLKLKNTKANNYQLAKKASVNAINVPIKFHVIRRANGTIDANNINIVPHLPAIIDQLNVDFGPMNLQFYMCGPVHYLDQEKFYVVDPLNERNDLAINNVNDAINIYLCSFLAAGNGFEGTTVRPSGSALYNIVITSFYGALYSRSLSRYLGEYWNLYPTEWSFNQPLELVNGQNCATTGDYICDTPADPPYTYYNEETCQYTGTMTDPNGQYYTPMINNIMSDYIGCRTAFTPGQYARMTTWYNNRLAMMNSSGQYSYTCKPTAAAPTNLNLSSTNNCNVTLSWTNTDANATGYIIESSTHPTEHFVAIDWVNKNTTTYYDSRTVESGTTRYYRVIASNASATPSAIATFVSPVGAQCYCSVAKQNCNIFYIDKVKIMQDTTQVMLNFQYCTSSGYYLNTTLNPTLETGKKYSTHINMYPDLEDRISCWIDFNRDGIFAAEERVFQSLQETPNEFMIPDNASEGKTRMRVRIQGYININDPCKDVRDGETEDYEITIKKACSQPLEVSGLVEANKYSNEYIRTLSPNSISPTSSVIYSAKKYVELNPGFVSAPSANNFFSIINSGCPE